MAQKTRIKVKTDTGYDQLLPETTTDQVVHSDSRTIDQILIDGTTTNKGLVQLTDGVTSTSITTAATPNSVKTAYDIGKSASDTLPSKAPLESPALTGIPTAPTPATYTNTTQIATTEFVNSSIAVGNSASATKLQTARTISLGGDLSGSATFDGTANVTITANVGDDSHNHSISTVNGLQAALDSKLNTAGGVMTGDITFANSGTSFRGITGMIADNDYWRVGGAGSSTNAGYMEIATADDGTEPIYVRQYTGVYLSLIRSATLLDDVGNTSFPGNVSAPTFSGSLSGNAGSATKLQTARSIALNGDVTGSTSFDGSGDVTITATIADDSHNHIISNIDGLQTALDDKAPFKEFNTIVKGVTWSRLLQLSGSDVSGHSLFVNISGTRNAVVYDTTFLVTFAHSYTANIVQLNNSSYSTFKIRGVVSDNGSGYIEMYDDASGITNTTDQMVSVRFLNLSNRTITPYTVFTSGESVPGDHAVRGEIRTVNGNSIVANLSGNAATSSKLQTPRTISLGGDVSGSTSFDGSGDVNISATVADDSHNHSISTVNGLQGTLDLKAPLASPALTGTPTAPTALTTTNDTQIATTAFATTKADEALVNAKGYTDTKVAALVDSSPGALDTLNELAAALGDDPNFATTMSNQIGTKLNSSEVVTSATANKVLRMDINGNLPTSVTGSSTKLQTARTISLGGDLTGSASFDGSGDITISAAVGDDSHNHSISTVNGLQTALDGKIPLSGSAALTGNLEFMDSGTTIRGIMGTVGSNDFWRVVGGATAGDAGFMEIATADNAEEPIYVRQYSGKFINLIRTATLLDTSGNTSFPGSVTAPTFNGNLSGNAATSSKLQTPRTISLGGDVTGSTSFDGSGDVTITATVGDDSHNHSISTVNGLQTALDSKLNKSGGIMTGDINMGTNKVNFGGKFSWQFNSVSNSMDLVVS